MLTQRIPAKSLKTALKLAALSASFLLAGDAALGVAASGSSSWTPQVMSNGLRVWTNPSGMPQCVDREVETGAVLFRYSGDRYTKKVWILNAGFPQGDTEGRNCENAETWSPETTLGWRELRGDETSISGVTLDTSTLNALAQARNGASRVHENSGDEYLAKHPIADFTRTVNQRMAGQLGMGFTSEVYHAWLEKKPKNAEAKRHFLNLLQRIEQGQQTSLAERAAQVRFVMIPGVGGNFEEITQDSPPALLEGFGGLPRIFKSIGLRFHLLKSATMAPIDDNIAVVLPRIREILSSGENIILIGGSRGLPEMMGVLARLKQEPPAQGAGKILGVVNLSGLAAGSLLCDAGVKWPVPSVVRNLVRAAKLLKIAGSEKISDRNVQAIIEMSSGPMSAYFEKLLPQVPRDVPYLSLVGTRHGNGLADGQPEIRRLQNMLIRPIIPQAAANDGYVEYPGTDLPEPWGLDSRTLVFNASHMIVDGEYTPEWKFSDPRRGGILLSGLFHMLLDMVEGAKIG